MATAEELLARTVTPETEPHIVIDATREVAVPLELQTIAVQFDHNIETVTFDTPRYWDGHDLSAMMIFINYMRADGEVGQFQCTDVNVDDTDNSVMHFSWTISGHVTEVAGGISFLVCAKVANVDGELKQRWNSLLNQQMIIKTGMNASDDMVKMEADVIASILLRLDEMEGIDVDWDVEGRVLNRPLYLTNHSVIVDWDDPSHVVLSDTDERVDTAILPESASLHGATITYTKDDTEFTATVVGYVDDIWDNEYMNDVWANDGQPDPEQAFVYTSGSSKYVFVYYIDDDGEWIYELLFDLNTNVTSWAWSTRGFKPTGFTYSIATVDPRYQDLLSNVEVDTTLTESGKAADAKTVGDKIGDIDEVLDAINGGTDGIQIGASAYEIAVANGFEGTEAEWLESLKGYTPVKGVDYFTEEDIQDIVNEVLAILPTWEGGNY